MLFLGTTFLILDIINVIIQFVPNVQLEVYVAMFDFGSGR